MTDTFRAVFKEMVHWIDDETHTSRGQDSLVIRARALLAQPEPEGLTDEELDRSERRCWKRGSSIEIEPEGIREVWDRDETFDHRAYARAVIAADRACRPTPQPPADGEVGELVETLKGIAYWRRHGTIGGLPPAPFDIRQADRLDRAAALLKRFASPACLVINPSPEALASLKAAGPGRIERLPLLVPVAQPVAASERPWERDGWCDEQGRCWWTANKPVPLPPSWWMVSIPQSCTDGIMLPFNALPLPQGNDN